jgi:hypothetical protein
MEGGGGREGGGRREEGAGSRARGGKGDPDSHEPRTRGFKHE